MCIRDSNWRGGWTVGPRYLALALPFLGWHAAEGGRVLWRAAPRVAGGIVVGMTAAAFLASGTLSAYYPHVPEAFTRPLPQLIKPLVQNDFAPYNAGSWLAEQLGGAWWGTASMLPMALHACVALAWIAWSERRLTDRILVLMFSAFFGSTCMSPIVNEDPSAVGAPGALEYVVRFWDPAGHDRASVLEARIRAHPVSEREWRDLVRSYAQTGRHREARGAERRARAAGYPLGQRDHQRMPRLTP